MTQTKWSRSCFAASAGPSAIPKTRRGNGDRCSDNEAQAVCQRCFEPIAAHIDRPFVEHYVDQPAELGDFDADEVGGLATSSGAGDYIGGGKSELWTLTESDFSIRGDNHQVQATASGRGDYWQLWFRAPSNGVLRVVAFTNAERAPFVTGKAPGLDIFGNGRGCNTVSGQFDVTRVVGWAANGDVVSIDVVFEQHCEGMVPALRGELWITTQAGVHKPLPNMSSPITSNARATRNPGLGRTQGL
jgi:hypothetical protein